MEHVKDVKPPKDVALKVAGYSDAVGTKEFSDERIHNFTCGENE